MGPGMLAMDQRNCDDVQGARSGSVVDDK